MIFFLSDYLRRNRSFVWLTVGGVIALAATVFVLAPRGLQFSPPWYHETGATTTDHSSLAQVAKTIEASKSIDPGSRVRRRGSDLEAGRTAGMKGLLAAATRPGRIDDNWGAVGSEADTNNDTDETLFSALERLERRMAAAIARARESVVALEYTAPDAPPGTRRVATGVVINHRGEILSVRIDPPAASQAPTAAGNSALIVARDVSGRCHSVHWVAADPESGLTLLRLPPRVVRPIRTATGGPNLGSQVFVVGNPFGMGHSVSRGHVAGLDRVLELGTRQLGGLIQVQAPLYPGDSGAAVVNLHGDWLGLIRSGLAIPGSGSETGPSSPIAGSLAPSGLSPSLAPTDVSIDRPERDTDFGFAIPVRDVLWVADQLRTQGRVDRAYLGVRLEPFSGTGSVKTAWSDPRPEPESNTPPSETAPQTAGPNSTEPDGTLAIADQGAILREVLLDTPASKAGLRPGDGIVELDGQPIRSAHDLTDRLDRIPARATILLIVVRDCGAHRQRISLSLRTASRPQALRGTGLNSPFAPTSTASTSAITSPHLPGFSSRPGGVIASPSANPKVQTRVDAPLPVPQPSDLRLTLPRAIVDRLEKLERRLEKLESFPAHATGHAASPEHQISSARNP